MNYNIKLEMLNNSKNSNNDHQKIQNSQTVDLDIDQAQQMEIDQRQISEQEKDAFDDQFVEQGFSFKTLSRGSLTIKKDNFPVRASSIQTGMVIPLIRPWGSEVFYEQQDIQRDQERLQIQANQLAINGNSFKSVEEISKKSQLSKNHTSKKDKTIKQVRSLIRELKRQYKYENIITADIVLTIKTRKLIMKNAIINPILKQSGGLQGLLLEHQDQQIKIRVKDRGVDRYEPVMELWDKEEECWLGFQFKIKLHLL